MGVGLSQTRRKPIHGGLIAASLLLTVCDRPTPTGTYNSEFAV